MYVLFVFVFPLNIKLELQKKNNLYALVHFVKMRKLKTCSFHSYCYSFIFPLFLLAHE